MHKQYDYDTQEGFETPCLAVKDDYGNFIDSISLRWVNDVPTLRLYGEHKFYDVLELYSMKQYEYRLAMFQQIFYDGIRIVKELSVHQLEHDLKKFEKNVRGTNIAPSYSEVKNGK